MIKLLFQMLIESTNAHILIRAVVSLVTIYCILINCRTAIISLKSFSADKLYPRFAYFSSKLAQQAGVHCFISIVGLVFIVSGILVSSDNRGDASIFPDDQDRYHISGKMDVVAVTVTVILLAAYALINFSTFHISLIQPVGWRPTFKVRAQGVR